MTKFRIALLSGNLTHKFPNQDLDPEFPGQKTTQGFLVMGRLSALLIKVCMVSSGLETNAGTLSYKRTRLPPSTIFKFIIQNRHSVSIVFLA
jgi:hypothetical protein